jgi:hypothetical protein
MSPIRHWFRRRALWREAREIHAHALELVGPEQKGNAIRLWCMQERWARNPQAFGSQARMNEDWRASLGGGRLDPY